MEILINDDLSAIDTVTVKCEGFHICKECGARMPSGVTNDGEITCDECGWIKRR